MYTAEEDLRIETSCVLLNIGFDYAQQLSLLIDMESYVHLGTMETMCHSLRDVVNTFENQPRVTGQCNMSEDCLTLDCSMTINATFVVLTANVKLTLLPCMKPYGIIAQTTSLLNNPINAVITETTSFVRLLDRIPGTVIFEVEQTDHGIDIGVSLCMSHLQCILAHNICLHIHSNLMHATVTADITDTIHLVLT